jgi:hypothetical protein
MMWYATPTAEGILMKGEKVSEVWGRVSSSCSLESAV